MKYSVPFQILILFIFFIYHSNSQAQISPHKAIVQMQKGINLGNTLEPPYETGWNNPAAEEYYFDMYKEAGFKLVRIPVRWDNHMGKSAPYKVDNAWMNRVESVVDWGLKRDLFVVLNSHHDNWIKENYNTTNKARFDSLWTQIALRFKDKSEKLFFEVLNEPKGLTRTQNDDMHARILQIIRKTNPTRIVIFQGHEWGGSDQLLEAAIPTDSFIIGSFHSYDPHNFTHIEPGDPKIIWGSGGDIAKIDLKFKKVKDWSDANNIPVFLGEFGARKGCDFNSRMKHYRAYVTLAEKYDFAHCAWDDGGNFRIMERQQRGWHEVKDILMHTYATSPKPAIDIFEDSIIRVRWLNYVWDYDSLLIQRKSGAYESYKTIATLPSDSNVYYDGNLSMNKYYYYRLIASYNDSLDMYSEPRQIFFPKWEKRFRATFLDSAHQIPGIIEAEDFDKGGEGIAYHDLDESNISGKYRPDEAVDIYERLGDGFHIGNALSGEWLTYTVNIQHEGWYDVSTHVAALFGGGTFQIEVDTIKSEVLTAPTCYSWLNTKPVSTKMYLYPGEQLLKFTILSDPLFNIDKFGFDISTHASMVNNMQNTFFAYQNEWGKMVIKQNESDLLKQIHIYDITGKLILSIQKPDKTEIINTNGIKKGIYFVQGLSDYHRKTQKISIQ